MVCPNCKHELNSQARVCPTCGTPVPGAPTVVVTPPGPRGAVVPRKKYVSAARVFTVIFCLVAVAAFGAMIAFWFLPAIQVTDNKSPASVTLFSMHALCRNAVPYLTYAIIAFGVVGALFCLLPLFKCFANKRCIMIVPKLMCVFSAVCYAVPYTVAQVARAVTAMTGGGKVQHSNPFTTICFGLLILLYVIGGLTSRNRFLVQRNRIETLEDQLGSYGIRPVE